MKTACSILFALLLAGCQQPATPVNTSLRADKTLPPQLREIKVVQPPPYDDSVPPGVALPTQSGPLNAERARRLAQMLANEKAHSLYGARPFRDDAPARLEQKEWIWSDFRGCDHGDMQASVRLAPDGTPLSVQVMLLISRPLLD